MDEREELHFRRIDMRGYRRPDGLFEVEGRVTDRKPHDFTALGGHSFAAGEPIHDMGVRLIFDDRMVVRAVETFTDAAPYPVCPAGGLALQALKGARIAGGWGRTVRERLARAQSCTHLVELLIPLGTVAFQSLSLFSRTRPERLDATGRPAKVDSCYAYAADRDLVRRRYPEYAQPPRRT